MDLSACGEGIHVVVEFGMPEIVMLVLMLVLILVIEVLLVVFFVVVVGMNDFLLALFDVGKVFGRDGVGVTVVEELLLVDVLPFDCGDVVLVGSGLLGMHLLIVLVFGHSVPFLYCF